MDVHVKAICIAGGYFRESGDKEYLEMLLDIFKNEQEPKDVREAAYSSISRAISKDWKDFQSIDIDSFSQNIPAQETIARAYELLTKK